MERKILFGDLSADKGKRKMILLAVYDYPFSRLAARAGIDMILVGDSLAKYALGLASNDLVGMTEMIHHAKAVVRGAGASLVIGDMPVGSCEKDPDEAIANARRFVDEAGCDAVKIEWFDGCLETVGKIVRSGIPVMGHIGPGLTPASDTAAPNKDRVDSAPSFREQAVDLEKRGCFSVLLDHMEGKETSLITRSLTVPTIGVGSGPDCDGQAMVIHHLIGLVDGGSPKAVKHYCDAASMIVNAIGEFKREVEDGVFPDPQSE